MHLILFDIDGTLLHCGAQLRPVLASALDEVFGATGDLDGYDFSGKTDSRIVLDLAASAGIPRAEAERSLGEVRERYLEKLARCLVREGMRLMPGVTETLERLAARSDAVVGLLTGNWEPAARIKLSCFDLNRFFPFGAYGDDAVDRRDLVPVALERAARWAGRRFEPQEVLVVGDSVEDVVCARAHGAPVLAVATGRTPAEALEGAGADWVVPDLPSASRCHPLFSS